MHSSISNSDPPPVFPRSHGWALALILLATWVAAAALLTWLDPYATPDPALEEASASLGPSTHILALGTSHVLCGINPVVLGPGAMNIAIAAADYETLLLILRHRLSDMPNLRVVLLEADNLCLFNIGLQRRDFNEVYVWGLSRADLPLGTWAYARQMILEQPLVAPFFFTRRLTPQAWVRRREPEQRVGGPGWKVFTGQVTAANGGLDRIRAHEQTISPESAARNRIALAELLQLLQQRDIRVILVTLPHDKGYTANASPRWQALFTGLLDEARISLGNDFVWWNLDGDPAFIEEDFHDGHHLNERGAAKLSELLRERLSQQGL